MSSPYTRASAAEHHRQELLAEAARDSRVIEALNAARKPERSVRVSTAALASHQSTSRRRLTAPHRSGGIALRRALAPLAALAATVRRFASL